MEAIKNGLKILGQHFINNEYDGKYAGSYCGEDELEQYIDEVIKGMKTGLLFCVTYPGLINYRQDEKVYQLEMRRLCEAALELKIPLEFNLIGFSEERYYPFEPFWKLASKTGKDVIIGCDAHQTEAVGETDIYESAVNLLGRYEINPICKMPIRSI